METAGEGIDHASEQFKFLQARVERLTDELTVVRDEMDARALNCPDCEHDIQRQTEHTAEIIPIRRELPTTRLKHEGGFFSPIFDKVIDPEPRNEA